MRNLLRNLMLLAALVPCVSAPAREAAGDLPADAPPGPELLLMELDSRRPDESSPFFADQQVARFTGAQERRSMAERDGLAIYPNTASYDSTDRIFGNFLRSLFRGLPVGPKSAPFQMRIEVIPSNRFLLSERREISAKLSFENATKKLMRLFFPTAQRFDLVIVDEGGAVVERWSKDRSFADSESAVMVNPGEKIEYEATLPTGGLRAGAIYILRAEIAGHPEYFQSVQLFPN